MAPPTWVWEGTSTAGTSTAVTPYPVSGVLAGDIPFIICASKASTGTGEPPAIADPTGFTKLGEPWGGTGTAGAGTGPVKLTIWKKTTDATGSENGTSVTVTNPANSSFVYCNIHGVRRATGGSTILTALVSGQDTTGGTAVSMTCGSDPGIIVDDLLLCLMGLTVNTSAAMSAEALTATSATFTTIAALNERDDDGTTSGNDARRVVYDAACTAGPATAAPVISATSASSAQSGVGAVLRIREQAAAAAIPAQRPRNLAAFRSTYW